MLLYVTVSKRFNDKKTSLADIGLSKIVVNNSSFGNQTSSKTGSVAGGEKAYEQAKTWLDSKDWETELKGLDAIVTLARNDPDVRNSRSIIAKLRLPNSWKK